MKDIENLGKSI